MSSERFVAADALAGCILGPSGHGCASADALCVRLLASHKVWETNKR